MQIILMDKNTCFMMEFRKCSPLWVMVAILTLPAFIHSQSTYKMKGNDRAIDVNFLSSYYQQEGNNSAVEGGVGTEHLIDGANMLIVNVPIDSSTNWLIPMVCEPAT